MIDKFELFESDVMKSIITENKILLERLEKQYKSAKIIKREFSGVGFFTDFEVTDKNSRLEKEYLNIELGNTQAEIEGLKLGVGFVLFISDGLIETLEGYTYGEPWPEKINNYKIQNL